MLAALGVFHEPVLNGGLDLTGFEAAREQILSDITALCADADAVLSGALRDVYEGDEV